MLIIECHVRSYMKESSVEFKDTQEWKLHSISSPKFTNKNANTSQMKTLHHNICQIWDYFETGLKRQKMTIWLFAIV